MCIRDREMDITPFKNILNDMYSRDISKKVLAGRMKMCIRDRHCHFVNGRKELLAYLKHTQTGTITDIRKIYQSGVTDSVMELYLSLIHI